MKPDKTICGILAALGPLIFPATGAAPPEFRIYTGMCDASAVVAIGTQFLIVGDDEESVLRVYDQAEGGAPVQEIGVGRFLNERRRAAEVDLEAAAPVGDLVYWITSHGRNAAGKFRPTRRRFFATRFQMAGEALRLEPVGRPYTRLLDDFLEDPRLEPFGLAAAAVLAPKSPEALNIEGLCATPDGHLLIGFRNPVPHGKALVVPLLNPLEVIAGSRARLGDPILLDLDGLGVRSLTDGGDGYWIIGGSVDGQGPSRVYAWAGGLDRPALLDLPGLANLNPEAMSLVKEPAATRLWILSDDGTVEIDGCPCKRLKDPRRKRFRAVAIDP